MRGNAFVSGGFLPKAVQGTKTEGYGTFCGLAGMDLTDTKAAQHNLPPVDSMDMWPLISGQKTTSPCVDIPISNTTLISGEYKILVGKVCEVTGQECGDTGCLYRGKLWPEACDITLIKYGGFWGPFLD